MLNAEDNDLLCRVDGDAPMGRMMRRHWLPACLSEEVAKRDGPPVRVRLLGGTQEPGIRSDKMFLGASGSSSSRW